MLGSYIAYLPPITVTHEVRLQLFGVGGSEQRPMRLQRLASIAPPNKVQPPPKNGGEPRIAVRRNAHRQRAYGAWDHTPQASTDVVEEPPADVDPAPRVSNTAAHDGAVIDEWESDCEPPEADGSAARATRSMSRLLVCGH